MIKPSYLFIVAKIQNPLNDILSVFFGIYIFWIGIPKKSLSEFHNYIISKNIVISNDFFMNSVSFSAVFLIFITLLSKTTAVKPWMPGLRSRSGCFGGVGKRGLDCASLNFASRNSEEEEAPRALAALDARGASYFIPPQSRRYRRDLSDCDISTCRRCQNEMTSRYPAERLCRRQMYCRDTRRLSDKRDEWDAPPRQSTLTACSGS